MNIFQTIKGRSKNYFLSGLIVVVPLVITILVIRAIFTFLDSLLLPYLQPYLGEWLSIPGVGILITILSIYFVGILVTNIIGRKFVNLGERFLLRIPIAKSIYGSVKQILQTFSFQEKQTGKKVVMLEYPKSDVWSVGLVNGEIQHPQTNEILYNILIIASINPTSGFFVMVPQNKTIHVDITVEDAMKWIVSGGIVTPDVFKGKKKTS